MKVVHICLCGPVTDGWNYQDNILPKYHRKLGHDVTVIASQSVYGVDGKLRLTDRTDYRNECDVFMIRLPSRFGRVLPIRLRLYAGLRQCLEKLQPDVLFIHGCQFLDMHVVVHYLKRRPNTQVYVDNHADFSNSARTWASRHLLHALLWKRCAQLAEPHAIKFYGVLPARVAFLREVYKLPTAKCQLLLMGADDERVFTAAMPQTRARVRERYGIEVGDFLVMTGGKIDGAKAQTLLLMQAVRNTPNERLKLIVFGPVVSELQDQVRGLCDGRRVQHVTWVEPGESYNYFAAADLVVFPGRHSVFWEQVAGQGIPMLCKYWEGTTHVDLGGNVRFLYRDSVEEIAGRIQQLLSEPETYERMKHVAQAAGIQTFSYRRIAMESLERDG